MRPFIVCFCLEIIYCKIKTFCFIFKIDTSNSGKFLQNGYFKTADSSFYGSLLLLGQQARCLTLYEAEETRIPLFSQKKVTVLTFLMPRT